MALDEATAPPLIIQLAAQLVACPSFVAAGGSAATVHYPRAGLSAAEAPVDRLFPLAVLEMSRNDIRPIASGMVGLPGGGLRIVLTAAGTLGEAEELARAIAAELIAQPSGIPFSDAVAGMAGEPPPEQLAVIAQDNGAAFEAFSVVIDLTWGLTA